MKKLQILLIALAVAVAAPVWAQEEGEQKKQQTIGERAFKRLEQAHGALGEKRYADVENRLQQMEQMPLNDYEKALIERRKATQQ